MSTRRLAESVEGLNSSLAVAAGDLWPKNFRPIAVVKGLRRLNMPQLYIYSYTATVRCNHVPNWSV